MDKFFKGENTHLKTMMICAMSETAYFLSRYAVKFASCHSTSGLSSFAFPFSMLVVLPATGGRFGNLSAVGEGVAEPEPEPGCEFDWMKGVEVGDVGE